MATQRRRLETAAGKRYAIIADTPVDIVDVTDPAAPKLAAVIPEDAHTVFTETIAGVTRAYFGNYDASCPVWDVSDPVTPVRLGRFQTTGGLVHDLSVADGIAYLNVTPGSSSSISPRPRLVEVGSWADTPTDSSHRTGPRVGGRPRRSRGASTSSTPIPADVHAIDRAHGAPDFDPQHRRPARAPHYRTACACSTSPTRPSPSSSVTSTAGTRRPITRRAFDGAVGLDVDLTRKLIYVADTRGLLILRDDTP
jgi:hypothetical protein